MPSGDGVVYSDHHRISSFNMLDMTDPYDEHNIYDSHEEDEYTHMYGIPVPVDRYKQSDSFKAGKRDWELTHRQHMPWIILAIGLMITIALLINEGKL